MEVKTRLPQSTVVWGTTEIPSSLTCVHCGQPFEVPAWQPRMRCPHCLVLGYPDRSGHYLLSLNWDCVSCGTLNDGALNFCLHCGTGLASRCLRCDQPVYNAVCNNCGACQSQLVHFSRAESQREAWIPVLREHIRQQQAQQELEENRRVDPTYGVAEWRSIEQQRQVASKQRSQRLAQSRAQRRALRKAQRQSQRQPPWGWAFITLGVAGIVYVNWVPISTWLTAVLGNLNVVAWWQSLIPDNLAAFFSGLAGGLQTWYFNFTSSFDGQSLNPSEPTYAYLFAASVIGVALLPVAFFLMGKMVRRLFP